MVKTMSLPWKDERAFYEMHAASIFSKFNFYHTAMIGESPEEFADYVIKRTGINDYSSVLDLGCGSGYLVNRLTNIGIGTVGLSNSEACINQAIANYPENSGDFVLGNMEDYVRNGCTHILALESIGYADIIKTLRTTYENLKSGGLFYIKHYFVREDESERDRENRNYFEWWWKYSAHRLDTFISLANDAGFRLEEFRDISRIVNQDMFWESMPYHEQQFELPYPQEKEFLIAGEVLLRKK